MKIVGILSLAVLAGIAGFLAVWWHGTDRALSRGLKGFGRCTG